MAQYNTTEVPPSSGDSLLRGKACISCRRRKLRCNGARPTCDQCLRRASPQDCEYTDKQGRTYMEVLEERIKRLQTRIHDLENPSTVAPPVRLQIPQAGTSRTRAQIINLDSDEGGTNNNDSNTESAAVTPPDTPSSPLNSMDMSYSATFWQLESPPRRQFLLAQFLKSANQLGFALKIDRFLDTITSPTLESSKARAAMLNAIYVWSLRLSGHESLLRREQAYLNGVLCPLASALDSSVPEDFVCAMQAESLLAIYFFCVGRFLEGRHHGSAAMSIAVSCRLHKIGSSRQNVIQNAGVVSVCDSYAESVIHEPVKAGEVIRAFWTVFNLNRCWSVALGSVAEFSDDWLTTTEIDTPWPLEFEDYDKEDAVIETGMQTVLKFIINQGRSVEGDRGNSFSAMRVKASALFERATRLSGKHKPDTPRSDNFLSEHKSLEATISNFTSSLPAVNSFAYMTAEKRQYSFVTHCLGHVSMIQLHNVFADSDERSYRLCLDAARSSMQAIEHLLMEDFEYLEPVVAVTWLAVSRVLMREATHMLLSPDISVMADAVGVLSEVNTTIALLEEMGWKFPLLAYHAATMKDLRDSLFTPMLPLEAPNP
ncbi:hypothetical protein BD410DRAFT_791397 [Rickenella mellea]|uniref:Zn(2)-C6 fungal-type domain-containing protein n=1 Tax=Rickenella mellea TaxID=50990 RepID=A0A4Y7PX92_9AGAM|nr:hypothetical protein BD410DRAFT_791397 [Rickenella mellea]